jgi:electron transfer flavoprotein beta subunit
MNLAVLIKQVPDTHEIRLDPKTGTLIREGVDSIINPDDRLGLELALNIKDQTGGKVTVLSMGPPQAVDALTEALAMGADQGVLLSDRNFAGADTWATSLTLGKALDLLQKKEGLAMVICGRQAIDGDTAQIGPQVAEHLGWPQITYVVNLSLEQDWVRAWRLLEGGEEEVLCPLPCLVTVQKWPHKPRFPRLDRLFDMCLAKAPSSILNAADIGCPARTTGLRGSLTQVARTFSPKSEKETSWLEGSPREQASLLLDHLREHKLI